MLRPHDLSRTSVEPSRTLTCVIRRAVSGRGNPASDLFRRQVVAGARLEPREDSKVGHDMERKDFVIGTLYSFTLLSLTGCLTAKLYEPRTYDETMVPAWLCWAKSTSTSSMRFPPR